MADVISIPFTTLDVFTNTRYLGNPVSLVHVPPTTTLTQAQKQAIAKEFNLSETVFLHPPGADGLSTIDIFTALAEVPFAGHPTIGSAVYVLTSPEWQRAGFGIPTGLRTKAGIIPISLSTDGSEARAQAEVPHDVHIHTGSIASQWTASPAPLVSIVKGMTFILAQLADVATLARPRENIIGAANAYDPAGLDSGWDVGTQLTYFFVITGEQDGTKLIRSRMLGSREDPATGSGASALCCWLALKEDRYKGKGPFEFRLTQGVEMGRRSEIGVIVTRTEDGLGIEKVLLSGSAVQVMQGMLKI